MCQFYGIPTLSFSCTSQINHWTLKPLTKCNTISVTRWFKFISVWLTVKHFSSSVKNKNSFQESNANSVNDIVHLLSWFGIQNTHPLDAWDPIYEKWHKELLLLYINPFVALLYLLVTDFCHFKGNSEFFIIGFGTTVRYHGARKCHISGARKYHTWQQG